MASLNRVVGNISVKIGTIPTPRWPARATNLAAALALAAFLGLVGLMLAAVGPTLLGYTAFIVTSTSMEPAVRAGSMLVSYPTRVESLGPGDVITFRLPDHPNTNLTHRIVAINYEHGERVFLTKGDANKGLDPEPARLRGHADRMIYAVPYAGYLVGFLRSRLGVTALLAIPTLGLATLEALSWRQRQRQDNPQHPSTGPSQASGEELRLVKEEVRQLREALGQLQSQQANETHAPSSPTKQEL